MTELQKLEWKEIENDIFRAYKNVGLEDGIGYYEAGALDNYLKPTDLGYIEEKNKDERYDWTRMLKEFEDYELDNGRHCFMDAKGLLFYLPFIMIRQDETINSILHFYISEIYKRDGYTNSEFTKTVSLMTKDQKHCIFQFYNFWSKIEHSDFWEPQLNYSFDTGEQQLKGFNFMKFIKDNFYQE